MRSNRSILAAAFAAALAFTGATGQSAPAKSYADLVAQAESGDSATDYTALRTAYAASDGYDPYGMDLQADYHQLWPAFQAKDCAKVITVSDGMLKRDYTMATVHVLRADCFRAQGDASRGDREEAIARGLADSLRHTGDGKSVATAYVVVTMSEERFLLVAIGLHEARQSLINDKGHMYDLIEGPNDNPGGPKAAYFNVDALFAGMAREFEKSGSPAPNN